MCDKRFTITIVIKSKKWKQSLYDLLIKSPISIPFFKTSVDIDYRKKICMLHYYFFITFSFSIFLNIFYSSKVDLWKLRTHLICAEVQRFLDLASGNMVQRKNTAIIVDELSRLSLYAAANCIFYYQR